MLTGQEIKERRTKLGISQKEFADRIHVSKSYMSEIESGKKVPTGETLRRIEVELGIVKSSEPLEVRVAKLRAEIESGNFDIDTCIEVADDITFQVDKDNHRMLGEVYLMMATMLREKNRLTDALRFAILAQDSFSHTSDILSWCKATFEIALIDHINASFGAALERCFLIERRLTTLCANTQFFLLVRVQTLIAIIASVLGNYSLMREYIAKCESNIEYVPESERDRSRASNDFLRGMSLLEAGAYFDAAEAFRSSYYTYKSLNDNANALRLRSNIAEAYLKAGEIERAYEIASEVYELKIKANQPPSSIARTVILLADIAWQKKDLEAVERYCNDVINQDVDIMERARGMRLLARVRRERNDMNGFNQLMTRAALLLHGNHIYLALHNEIIMEYMVANHLPESLVEMSNVR